MGPLRLLAALGLLGLIAPPAGAASLTGRAEIIDGDTLRLAGQAVRLEGIDAPEARQECEDAARRPYPCGQSATEALGRLVTAAEVSCEVLGEDAYGRALALCEAGGVDVNREMVRQGWALAFRRYSDRYVPDEARAAEEGVGMWSGTFDAPWQWRTEVITGAAAGDCVIKGNISRTGERIYHLPFQVHYDRTRIDERAGERWFCSETEADDAGWRRALR